MKRLGIEGARPTVRPSDRLGSATLRFNIWKVSYLNQFNQTLLRRITFSVIIVTPFPSLKNSFDFRVLWYAERRSAFAGPLSRRPWFDPRSVHVGFMVDKVAPRLGQDSGSPLSASFPLCLIIIFHKLDSSVSFKMFFTRKNWNST